MSDEFHSAAEQHKAVSAWFLGPQAESYEFFKTSIIKAIESHREARLNWKGDEPDFITEDVQSSEAFLASQDKLRKGFEELSIALKQSSVPFWSPRYQAHMTTDPTVPAFVGYFTTMLYNPNNVAIEASPFTTLIELDVGKQLCGMLGYNTDKQQSPLSWGHIACDGSVANLESICAMGKDQQLEFAAKSFKVETCDGREALLSELECWDMLNLKASTILEIPERFQNEYLDHEVDGKNIGDIFTEAMQYHGIQAVGKDAIEREWGIDQPIQYLATNTKHYSWPKGAAIVGIGFRNVVGVEVDEDASMDISALEVLLEERYRKKQAVYAVVAIIGSTEEGAIDRLTEILRLRKEYQKKGMSFLVHADAAWGGYFASTTWPREKLYDGNPDYVPGLCLRKSVQEQLFALGEADSITIDPHKAGYIQYPAGSLCYRDGRMRYLVTWTTAYISGTSEDESIGIFGVEGSKPGAAAVATWMSNQHIGLDRKGYGALLSEAVFTSSRFSAHWAAMKFKDNGPIIIPLNKLPSEKSEGSTPEEVEKEREYIREYILDKNNSELTKDAIEKLRGLGSDLTINVFSCNFRVLKGGEWEVNNDIEKANDLNIRIVKRLSVLPVDFETPQINDAPFFLTSTKFKDSEYGVCSRSFKRRLGLEGDEDLFVLRNVVLSPFPTQRNYIKELAEVVKNIIEEEVATSQRTYLRGARKAPAVGDPFSGHRKQLDKLRGVIGHGRDVAK